MKLPKFAYLAPESTGEFCKIAAAEGARARIIAGGTDLLVAMKYGLKKPEMLLDISRIPQLDQIAYTDQEGLKVGALVSLRRLAAHPVIREKYPLLVQSALSVGSVQLQAMGTIGGNLCQDSRCLYYNRPPVSRQTLSPCFKLGGEQCHAVNGSKVCLATYAGDMAPALLALQASVTIAGPEGEKTIPLLELYSGRGKTPHILKPGELLKEIQMPPPTGKAGVYLKMRLRKSIDYPLLGVAVILSPDAEKGNLWNISLALTAVERSPLLIKVPDGTAVPGEREKQGEILAEAAYNAAHPIANTSGYSPRYRREMVKGYVRQGICQAMEIASGKGGIA
jgi:4-hydroxybenzoyl-CoA reductase subunit beta